MRLELSLAIGFAAQICFFASGYLAATGNHTIGFALSLLGGLLTGVLCAAAYEQ